MHLVIPVSITTAIAAGVMRQMFVTGTKRPEEID